ncbi:MAG: hypothetical protein CR981_02675 [Proteobacteria bacterium]|nr:MAG: hypothetical protein CR981_02675 [Pseudomonadota bacterium]
MNRNIFKNPLIQSALILLALFYLIVAIASSPSHGFFGGILAIIVTCFKTILFLFGLSVALVFSIAVLIGIFIAAVSLSSPENGKAMFKTLQNKLAVYFCSMKKRASTCVTKGKEHHSDTPAETKIDKARPITVSPAVPSSSDDHNRMTNLEKHNADLRSDLNTARTAIATMQAEINELKDHMAGKTESAADSETESPLERIAEQSETIAALTARIAQLEGQQNEAFQTMRDELAHLQKKTSIPEVISGILSYIDSPADRDTVTEKIEEAVSRGMTYNQADTLFKNSLPPEIYKILTDHPRLTKDYIRSVKKKFQ